MTFKSLGLSQPILAALEARDYMQPTPIQQQAIPPVLAGRDILGIAQTGTGKTAAFILPTIQRLVAAAQGRPIPGRVRMLVLAPTRELAAQIADNARAYASGQHVRVGVVFGGVPVPRSIREVSRGLDILVATPGRLLDLVDQRAVDLRYLEILVLDEADQMMDLGFIHDLKRVVNIIPEKRQTLFFSATMPKQIRQLADQYCRNPVEVKVTPVATTAERIQQTVTYVSQREKQALLNHFFQTVAIDLALVFSRTKHGADRIVRRLEQAGIDAAAIHGNKSQAQRERALAAFRAGEVRVLVATDIAARGIDIPGVSHVINFDLPNVPEQYVHRIGRTARAGAEGIAYGFCDDTERGYLRAIEKLTRQRIADVPLPENFNDAVAAVDDAGEPMRPRRGQRPRHAIKGREQGQDRRGNRREQDTEQRGNRREDRREQGQEQRGNRRDPGHRGSPPPKAKKPGKPFRKPGRNRRFGKASRQG